MTLDTFVHHLLILVFKGQCWARKIKPRRVNLLNTMTHHSHIEPLLYGLHTEILPLKHPFFLMEDDHAMHYGFGVDYKGFDGQE
jgi:hypothetical protein